MQQKRRRRRLFCCIAVNKYYSYFDRGLTIQGCVKEQTSRTFDIKKSAELKFMTSLADFYIFFDIEINLVENILSKHF